MDKHRILLKTCPTMDHDAETLQAHFHVKFGIPLERILLHPRNIADPVAPCKYGDAVLGISASLFPEFIDAFVQEEITRISTEGRAPMPPPSHPGLNIYVPVQRNRPGILPTVSRLPDRTAPRNM